MKINVGDRFPEGTLRRMGENGPEEISLADVLKGRKVVIFGLPGAFTSTCTAAHVPSFIRTYDAFIEKGVDEIICFAVNDIHVMARWGEATGATETGITMLADVDASLTKALGLEFTVPPLGFFDRTTRCAMVVDDGKVTAIQLEEERGVCNMTAGESLLELV